MSLFSLLALSFSSHGRVLESYPDEGRCVDPVDLRFSHPGSSALLANRDARAAVTQADGKI